MIAKNNLLDIIILTVQIRKYILRFTYQKIKRWKTMARVAFGQGKMGARPLSAFFHLIVYLGFVIINIEVIEILLGGLPGKQRILKDPLGIFYNPIMSIFECLRSKVNILI